MPSRLSYQLPELIGRIAEIFINKIGFQTVLNSSDGELSLLFHQTKLPPEPYDVKMIEALRKVNPDIKSKEDLYLHLHVLDRANKKKLSKQFISIVRKLVARIVRKLKEKQKALRKKKQSRKGLK